MAKINKTARFAAVALALATLDAGSQVHAANVRYTFIPIYLPPGPPTPFAPGVSADMPLELTDALVARTEGVIGLHDVVAHHTVRAVDAVVLLDPVQGRRGPMPAGTALAKVVFHDAGRDTVVWCDMRLNHGAGGDVSYDCLSGSGTDRFDNLWSAKTSDEFFGFGGDEALTARGKLNQPAAYRIASEQERPTGLVGYEWCGGDGKAAPPRFEVSASFAGGYWENSESHACPFGLWAGPSRQSTVVVDRIQIEVAPGPKAKTLSFKVLDRIAPSPIAHFQPGGPIRSLADAKAEASDLQIGLAEQALIPSEAPAKVAAGPIAKGDVLFSATVKHGLTGVLKNDIWLGKYDLFGQSPPSVTPSLKAGQVVYARIINVGNATQLAWCAPRKAGDKWKDAACLPSDGTGYVWVESTPALLVGELVLHSPLLPYATPPIVQRGPIEMPAMTLSYSFAGWAKDVAKIEAKIDWGEGAETFKTASAKIDRDGKAAFAIMGGELAIRPGATADEALVEYTSRDRAGARQWSPRP